MKGRSEGGMAMMRDFFDILRSNLRAPRGLSWQFVRWAAEPAWRRDFLAQFGLSVDIVPGMSREGGGSSFTGTNAMPSAGALENRFRMVQPEQGWRRFLAGVVTHHPDCFEVPEKQRIQDFLATEAGD